MASFKVGDKARFVRFAVDAINNDPRLIGAEVEVVECHAIGWQYTIRAPFRSNSPSHLRPDCFGCDADELAPILDPGTERDAAAERFIEKLKQLGREPVTLTERELEKISGGRAVLPSGCAPIVGRGGK